MIVSERSSTARWSIWGNPAGRDNLLDLDFHSRCEIDEALTVSGVEEGLQFAGGQGNDAGRQHAATRRRSRRQENIRAFARGPDPVRTASAGRRCPTSAPRAFQPCRLRLRTVQRFAPAEGSGCRRRHRFRSNSPGFFCLHPLPRCPADSGWMSGSHRLCGSKQTRVPAWDNPPLPCRR